MFFWMWSESNVMIYFTPKQNISGANKLFWHKNLTIETRVQAYFTLGCPYCVASYIIYGLLGCLNYIQYQAVFLTHKQEFTVFCCKQVKMSWMLSAQNCWRQLWICNKFVERIFSKKCQVANKQIVLKKYKCRS